DERASRIWKWCLYANVSGEHAPSESSKSNFAQLSDFRLPRSLAHLETPPYIQHQDYFTSCVRDWAHRNPKLLVDDDEHDLLALYQVLSLAHSSILYSLEIFDEISHKRGVDLLINLAFCARSHSVHDMLYDQDIRVPPGNNTLKPYETTDLLVVSRIPYMKISRIKKAIQRESLHEEMRIFCRGLWSKAEEFPPESHFSLISFPVEMRRISDRRNTDQLTLALSTAQSQRRALGIENSIIWGATYYLGQFVVYSAEWVDDCIVLARHHMWKLYKPVELLNCFTFLCNVANDSQDLRDALNKKSCTSIAESLVQNPWRPPTPIQLDRTTHFMVGGPDGESQH
ncbi:hypothetical protein AX17_002225, partial [Amanita inopinata Kibby_2008]